MTQSNAVHFQPERYVELGSLGRVCRLGLATRGNTHLESADVLHAIDSGIDVLNWCGYDDGLSQCVRRLGSRRQDVRIVVQFEARTATAARRELSEMLEALGTDYIDVVTYYYVETQSEWDEILAADGAASVLEEARSAGAVRTIGLTSHQRALAAAFAASGHLDLLMIRYNAAHRGAEKDVFPVCAKLKLPVITYTGLRWGALLRSTPDDPADFQLPTAADCYRFVLCHPGVAVEVMAPDNRRELDEDLGLLEDWRGLDPLRYAEIAAHGDRVRRHAGAFP